MNIPKYWAKAETEVDVPRKGCVALRKWHWSGHSITDAQQKAREALENMVARVKSGEPFPERYAYSSGQPLREEIIHTVSSAPEMVITRNVYGAQVLNVEHAMFVDVDLPPEARARYESGSGLLQALFSIFHSSKSAARSSGASTESPAESTVARIESCVEDHGGWGFRIYRTASGLRLLATHDVFKPDAPETIRVLQELGCDPLYVTLCKAQKSFRARLTPKPWRMKLDTPQIRFPYEGRQEAEIRRWIARYEAASHSRATCTFIKAVGDRRVHPDIKPVIHLHDEMTRAEETGLELA